MEKIIAWDKKILPNEEEFKEMKNPSHFITKPLNHQSGLLSKRIYGKQKVNFMLFEIIK